MLAIDNLADIGLPTEATCSRRGPAFASEAYPRDGVVRTERGCIDILDRDATSRQVSISV